MITKGGKVLDIKDDLEDLDKEVRTEPEKTEEVNKSVGTGSRIRRSAVLIDDDEPIEETTQ